MDNNKVEFESEVIKGLAELHIEIKNQGRELGKINDALYGNGHPGLISRMNVIENDFRWAKWIAGAIGGTIGFIGSILGKLFLKGDF